MGRRRYSVSAISINIDDSIRRKIAFDDTRWHFTRSIAERKLRASPPVPNATTGDPRTNAEQLRFDLNGASAATVRLAISASGLNNNNIPGIAPPLHVWRSQFATLIPVESGQTIPAAPKLLTDAPAVIANANLTSIGQLGDILIQCGQERRYGGRWRWCLNEH